MLPVKYVPNRRSFLKASVGMAAGLSTLAALPVATAAADSAWMVGPQPGFHSGDRHVDIHVGLHAYAGCSQRARLVSAGS